MKTINKNNLDKDKLLSSIFRMNSQLEKGYLAVEDLFRHDSEITEAQLCSVLSSFIPSISKHLNTCTGFVPKTKLSKNDIQKLRKDDKVRIEYQHSLELISAIAERMMPAKINKKNLQAVYELLKLFCSIGTTLVQAYPRSKRFISPVGTVEAEMGVLNMMILGCHE